MKRIYKVVVSSDMETAELVYRVVRDNLRDAENAGLVAYRRAVRNGDKLYGRVRVTAISEIGVLD